MRNHLVGDRTVNMQHSLSHLPMSRLMDFSRHPTAAQITIHSYCFHHYGLGSDAVFVQLTLEPLEGGPRQVNVFNQKFPKPVHMTTIASDHIGHHKTPSDTVAQPNTFAFNNGYKQRKLDYIESPWIECTMTGDINSMRLHVQDEQGCDIKPHTELTLSRKTFQAELQFADIPQ